MGVFSEFWRLIRIAALGWWNDRAVSLGASISFFTVFSLAPMLLAAKVWTYWIGFSLALLAVLVVLAVVVGYLVKVVRPQYPGKR